MQRPKLQFKDQAEVSKHVGLSVAIGYVFAPPRKGSNITTLKTKIAQTGMLDCLIHIHLPINRWA